MADASTITVNVGSVRSSLGSALFDIEQHLETVVVGTVHGTGAVPVGPGKYFQGYTVYEANT